jgi:hypothetical protein
MSLVLIEGCDDAGAAVGTTARGRTGKGLASYSSALPAAAQFDTITFGVALRHTTTPLQDFILISATGSSNVNVRNSAARSLSLRFNGGSILTSPDLLWDLNTWHYLEVAIKLGTAGTGTVATRLNGVAVPSLTSNAVTTKTGATAENWNNVSFGSMGATTNGVDDIYVCTASTTPDPFLGDCTVEVLYPNGNGAASAWAGSDLDSVDNWAHIDETPWISADWIGSSTPGAQNLSTLTDLVGAGNVRGICHHIHAQRTDATARSIKVLTRGSTTDASPPLALGTGFAELLHVMPSNPEGGAWTAAAVNALQVGVEVA